MLVSGSRLACGLANIAVLTFCGAQEALSAIYQTVFFHDEDAKIKKSDNYPEMEIIVVTPSYPSLVTMAEQLGIKVRCLEVNFEQDWKINEEELISLVNEKTRLIVLNSPHNPSGSIINTAFSQKILAVAKKFNCYLLADDVSQASNYNNIELMNSHVV